MAKEQRTQDFLEIQDIQDGIVILKNNDLRGILKVSSMNFALKSADDQSSIIYAFQSFLNSLDFSCQIIVQSRKINITPYLDSLKDLEGKQANELMQLQTAAYRDFIQDIVEGESVMTKNFYVAVPYALTAILGAGAITKKFNLSELFGKKSKAGQKIKIMSDQDFEKCKNQLWQRLEFVSFGLRRCGLESAPLTTQELVELFWAIHHPDQAEVGYSPEIAPELLQ